MHLRRVGPLLLTACSFVHFVEVTATASTLRPGAGVAISNNLL